MKKDLFAYLVCKKFKDNGYYAPNRDSYQIDDAYKCASKNGMYETAIDDLYAELPHVKIKTISTPTLVIILVLFFSPFIIWIIKSFL